SGTSQRPSGRHGTGGAIGRPGAAASAPSPLVREGWGGGSGGGSANVPDSSIPTPDPSPQGGAESMAPSGRRLDCMEIAAPFRMLSDPDVTSSIRSSS